MEHWTEYRIREINEQAMNMGYGCDDFVNEAVYQSISYRMDGILMSTTYLEDEDDGS